MVFAKLEAAHCKEYCKYVTKCSIQVMKVLQLKCGKEIIGTTQYLKKPAYSHYWKQQDDGTFLGTYTKSTRRKYIAV